MKQVSIALLMTCLVISCTQKKQPGTQQATKPATVVLHVDDFSKSTTPITRFDSSAAQSLYYTVAVAGGGVVKLVGVYENSANKNIYTMPVVALPDTDLSTGETNIYKVARAKSKSQKTLAAFTGQATRQITRYIAETSKPHDANYTDLQGALELARVTLAQPLYSDDCKKWLLICSDMVNNLKGKGHVPLKPIRLTNTTVLIVRPSLSSISEAQLTTLFPGSTVYVFTDIHDAISMIAK